jgi:hypothetical protein
MMDVIPFPVWSCGNWDIGIVGYWDITYRTANVRLVFYPSANRLKKLVSLKTEA